MTPRHPFRPKQEAIISSSSSSGGDMGASGTEARLRAHVAALAGTIGERHLLRPRALAAAADYITETWQAQGYVPQRETYVVNDLTCANLVVTHPGRSRADEILLIGAHYDTVPGSPGADDNASGVAGLLEITRAMVGIEPELMVRCVAFTNEEPPFFRSAQQGSAVHAQAARARGERIALMVALEMLGFYDDRPGSQRYPPLFRWFYPDRGDFLGFVADFRSRQVMRRAAAAFRAACSLPLETCATFRWIPGVAWSDHGPFWRQGYRAFMVTDTAFHRNPFYHQPGDVPGTLDYRRFAAAVGGLVAAATTLATAK
jgi:Zn-dependent M28 family amino/carboxypeptidase